MKDDREICGTCKHHVNQNGEWICLCNESDEFTDYTDYNHTCDYWEGRK